MGLYFGNPDHVDVVEENLGWKDAEDDVRWDDYGLSEEEMDFLSCAGGAHDEHDKYYSG